MEALLQVLWWVPLPLLVVLLGVMFWRHSIRVFPWFFIYVFYTVLATILRFVLRNHEIYARVYWFSDAGSALLGIIVMYEVFRSVSHKLIPRLWVNAIFPATVRINTRFSVASNGSCNALKPFIFSPTHSLTRLRT